MHNHPGIPGVFGPFDGDFDPFDEDDDFGVLITFGRETSRRLRSRTPSGCPGRGSRRRRYRRNS
jgi:hypothetical protein